MRLSKDPSETTLIDRSGRPIKMEPLTTVGQLNKYLTRMVAKQWYDYDRSSFHFVKQLAVIKKNPIVLEYSGVDFDTQGLFYWMGTNGGLAGVDWVNPAQVNLVVVSCSEGRNLPYGHLEDILSRDTSALNCHTNDDRKAWFSIDLGVWLVPTHYTLRHARGYGRSALRNWQLQGSRDGVTWTPLYTHQDDCSLNEPGSTATWKIPDAQQSLEGTYPRGWRHLRIQQTGKNASGQTHYLSLSGMEVYGELWGVCDDLGRAAREHDQEMRRQRRAVRQQLKGQSTQKMFVFASYYHVYSFRFIIMSVV